MIGLGLTGSSDLELGQHPVGPMGYVVQTHGPNFLQAGWEDVLLGINGCKGGGHKKWDNLQTSPISSIDGDDLFLIGMDI